MYGNGFECDLSPCIEHRISSNWRLANQDGREQKPLDDWEDQGSAPENLGSTARSCLKRDNARSFMSRDCAM